MARADVSIRQAISPVAFDNSKLHRERLVDALHGEVERKVIAIAAPAGYGKTTLLADFSADTDLPVCWARLSEADRDYAHLSEVVYASLSKRFRRLGSSPIKPRPRTSSPQELGSTIGHAISESIPEAFVFIIDDVQILDRDEASLEFLDSMVLASPEQATFILSGRRVPEISLGRLMAEGNLVGFGPNDLAISKDELVRLSNLAGGILTRDRDVEALLEESQGWITGVLLSSSFARHRLRLPSLDDQSLVYEYLASATLNRMPADVREFLLESSIPPRLTAEECDRLRGASDSEELLNYAVQSGLFIVATGEHPPTYEYHPMFSDFLQETLRAADPGRFRTLNIRAADEYRDSGDYGTAVNLYLKAGEVNTAVDVMPDASRLATDRGWLSTLEDWREALKSYGHKVPELELNIARCLMDRGRLTDAVSLLREIDLGDEGIAHLDRLQMLVYAQLNLGERSEAIANLEQLSALARESHEAATKAKYSAVGARFRAMLLLRDSSDYLEALDLCRRAVDFFTGVRGEEPNLIAALHTQTAILESLSRFREALASAAQALDIQGRISSPAELSTALCNLGVLYHQTGEFEDSLEHFTGALRQSKLGASEVAECYVLISQADLFNDLGLARQSGELYEKGLELALRLNRRDLVVYACAKIAMLHRRRTTRGVAVTWIQRAMQLAAEDAKNSALLGVERLGIELGTNRESASESLEKIVSDSERRESAPRSDEVLACYFLAHACFNREELSESTGFLRRLFAMVSRGETHQTVASEFLSDPGFYEFARLEMGGDLGFSMVESRVTTMQGMQSQFGEVGPRRAPSKKGLRIDALGPLRIHFEQEDFTDDLKPQAREVLVFLADRGSTEKEDLAEVFWSSHPPGRRIANLHMAVYSLRACLSKEAISLDGVSYQVSPGLQMGYDVLEFEKAASIAERLPAGDPRRLFAITQALSLYTGPFMVGYESDWVIDRRRDVELRYLDLVGLHAEETLVRNQPRLALARLRDALTVEPLRDDLNAKYIEALEQLDQRTEAIRHYQRYRDQLDAELGLEPSDEVEQVYLRLIS